MTQARPTPLWGWLLVVLFGCGDAEAGTIEVSVTFDAGLPRSTVDGTERVEVYLVPSCAGVAIGGRPIDDLASTVTLRDGTVGPPLGAIDPGEYGLYARGQDATCAVVAAGCTTTEITSSTSGAIEVAMSGFAGAPCDADEQCVIESGECLDTSTGGQCDAEPDETPCAIEDADGLCRNDACCTGCWDGSICRPGTHTQNCGQGGAVCEFVPGCPF